MKMLNFEPIKTAGTVATLAMLLAVGNVHAGKPLDQGGNNSPKNDGGASIGVSNVCWIEVTTRATLFVETTMLDKSSGDEVPIFENIGVLPLQKVKNREYGLGDIVDPTTQAGNETLIADLNQGADELSGSYQPFVTQIDLCAGGLKLDATSVNANVRVQLYNSNNTYTNSKCTARDENGLKIGGLGLCQ